MKKGHFRSLTILLLLVFTTPLLIGQNKLLNTNSYTVSNVKTELVGTETKNIINNYEYQQASIVRDKKVSPLYGLEVQLYFKDILFLSDPVIGSYYLPIVPETTNIYKAGYPALPVNITVIELPYEATNIDVTLVNITEKTVELPTKIMPSPRAFLLGTNNISINEALTQIKMTTTQYPKYRYNFKVYSGIDPYTLERKRYVVIYFYPLQYDFCTRKINFAKSATIKIHYNFDQKIRILESNSIDILIITNNDLYETALGLSKIKNQTGLSSIVKTAEWIYDNFAGRDNAEKIRNYIKTAVENLGIKFVIIFGDADIVPVRYAWIPDGAYDYDPLDDSVVETDLYYADLDYTWDDNNDGKWGDLSNDKVDGVPDVIVGRIPVSNETEAEIYLKKLSIYKPTSDWLLNTLLIGTDTFGIGAPEGEYLVNHLSRYLWNNISTTRLFETAGNLSLATLNLELNKGYGYINYGGHGDIDEWIISIGEVYSTQNVRELNNGYRLPIIFSMACLTGRFADTDGIGENFIVSENGGAIAYIGSTRLAWGYIGELVITGLAGEMNWRFVKALYSPLREHIGLAWAQMIKEYVINHPISLDYYGYYLDWKTVAEFVFFGDPTISYSSITVTNQTQLNTLTVSAGSTLKIANSLHYQNGDLIVNNGTLIVSNATLILNNSDVLILNGTLVAINSTIVGSGSVLLNNSIVEIKSSNIDISNIIAKGTSKLLINTSTIDDLWVYKTVKLVEIYDSVAALTFVLSDEIVSTTILTGYLGSHDYSTGLDFNVSVYQSWLSISIYASNSSLSLINSNVSHIISIDSNISLADSKIPIIEGYGGSNITSVSSRIGLNLNLNNVEGELTLNSSNLYEKLVIDNTNISQLSLYIKLVDTEMKTFILNITQNSNLTLRDSRIGVIYLYKSNVTVNSSILTYITAYYSDLIIANTSIMMLNTLSTSIEISQTHLSFCTMENSETALNDVRLIHVVLYNTTMQYTTGRIEYLNLFGTSTLSTNNATILSLIAEDNSSVHLYKSRLAIIFSRHNSSILIENTSVIFGIRLLDNSSILAVNSSIWPELMFINETISIDNLIYGYLESIQIRNTWNLTVIDSYVYGWDILSYNSNITVSNSYIFWLYGFYSSRIDVQNSRVMVLRLTHTSVGKVKLASIYQCIISMNSTLAFSKSNIYLLYGLGNAKISGSKSTVSQAVAFMNTSMSLSEISEMTIAPFDYSNVSISSSSITLWLELYDIKMTDFATFQSGFYTTLTTEDIGIDGLTWNLKVDYSKIAWTTVFINSTVKIQNSKLQMLGALSSNFTLLDSIVIDFLGVYSSNLTLNNCVSANITSIMNSEGTITESSFSLLAVYKSNVTLRNSIATIVLFFDSGHVSFKLQPGFYEKTSLSNFGSYEDPNLIINIENTSVSGWMLLLMGNATGSISDSSLISVGTFDYSYLSVTRTFIYGYLEAFGSSEIFVSDSYISRLYLQLIKTQLSISMSDTDIDSFYIDKNVKVGIENCTLKSIYIDAYYTNITIQNTSIVSELNLNSGVLNIINSSISHISTKQVELSISESTISTLSIIDSLSEIYSSTIKTLTPSGTSIVEIDDSSIGVHFDLVNAQTSISSTTPMEEQDFVIINGLSVIQATSTDILSWSFSAHGFTNMTITSSNISVLAVHDFAHVEIADSYVTSLKIQDRSTIKSEDSIVGIELVFKNDYADVTLTTGMIQQFLYSPQLQVGYQIELINSGIYEVNITDIGSTLNFDKNEIYVLYGVAGSSIFLSRSDIFFALLGPSTSLQAENSDIRFIIPSQSNLVEVYNSRAGLTAIFMNEKMEVRYESGYKDFYDVQSRNLDWKYHIEDTLIYDWRLIALASSQINVSSTHILLAYADGNSRILMFDCLLEVPPIVDDLGEIAIYWTLKVHVIHDFLDAENALVSILRENSIITESRTDNKGLTVFVLPQAVIRSNERIDLGHYTIKASYGGSEILKDIYLWKSMEIQLYMFSVFSIALIAISAIVIAFLLVIITKSRKKETQPFF